MAESTTMRREYDSGGRFQVDYTLSQRTGHIHGPIYVYFDFSNLNLLESFELHSSINSYIREYVNASVH